MDAESEITKIVQDVLYKQGHAGIKGQCHPQFVKAVTRGRGEDVFTVNLSILIALQ